MTRPPRTLPLFPPPPLSGSGSPPPPPLPVFLERGDLLAPADLHLDRPGVVRAGNEIRDAGLRRVGHVEDGPAAVPKVARVEVPAAARLPDRELEGRPPVDVAVADHAHVARDRARRNLRRSAGDEKNREDE